MAAKKPASKARTEPAKPAKEKPKEEAKAPKDDFTDSITSPFKQWWAYIKANFKKCYLTLLTIALIALIAETALDLVSSLAFNMMLPMFPPLDFSDLSVITLFAGGILALLLFGLFAKWLVYSISMTSIVFINSEFTKQPFGIWSAANAIRGKIFRFLVITYGIMLVIALPLILVVVLLLLTTSAMDTMPVAGAAAFMFLLLLTMAAVVYYFVALFIFSFITQFWGYGFILEGLGVVDSLKRSVALVRKRFFECLIFDIALGVITLIAAIPAMMVSFGVYFVVLFATVFLVLLPLPFYLVATSLLSLVVMAIVLVFATIASCISQPTQYLFWKKISGK